MTIARHALVVGVTGALSVSAGLLSPINSYDGGLVGSAGTFLLHGALPYRDYWWLYGPAAPALVGSLVALFGPSLLLLRMLGMVLIGVQATAGYGFLRPRMPHVGAAILVIGGLGTSSFLTGLEVTSWSLALTLAIAGLVLRMHDQNRAGFAGLLIGLAFAARFDVGCYALVAGLLLGRRTRFVMGFAVIAVPTAAILLATTSITDLYEQVIWYPIVGPRQFRGLPSQEIISPAAFELFVIVVVLPKAAIVVACLRLALDRGRARALFVITVFALLCQLQTFGRGDLYHNAQAAFPGFLVLGWLGGPLLRRDRGPISRQRAYARLVGFGAIAGASALTLVGSAFSLTKVEIGPLTEPERELVAGIRTLDANSDQGERVFVGLTNHRITILNDMLAYYLADRASGVRVAMFNPGVTNTDRVQTQMASDLASNGTKLLLLNDALANLFEPSNDTSIPGSTILDAYIAGHYKLACDYGSIRILATPDRLATVSCVAVDDSERLIDILAGLRPVVPVNQP